MIAALLCASLMGARAGFGAREGVRKSLVEEKHDSALPSDLLALLSKHQTADNVIMLAMTNFGEVDLALNMACSLKEAGGLDNLVIIATDESAKKILQAQSIPVYFDANVASYVKKADTSEKADTFGGKTWSLIAVQKLLMIALVANAGFNVFFTDVDVVFQKNPFPLLHCGGPHPHAKFMWDGPSLNLSKGIYTEGVKPHYGEPKLFPHEANGGFMLICANEHTGPMLTDAAHSFAAYFEKGQCLHEWWCHDQYFVNQAISRAVEKGLKYELFDKHQWANGWLMKNRAGYRMNPLIAEGFYDPTSVTDEERARIFDLSAAVVVHANWCSNKEQKLYLLLKEWQVQTPWWKCDTKCPMLQGVEQSAHKSNPLFDENGNCKTTQQLSDYLEQLDVR